jgi:lysophospholipase L1-like esterase
MTLGRLRIVQGAHFLLDAARSEPEAPRERHRVPPEAFEENLERLFEAAREDGAIPIAVTLPSGLRREDFPNYLVESGFAAAAGEAIRDHRRYAERIRQAARSHGVAVVDLEATLRAGDGETAAGLLLEDGIHPTPEGYAGIADAVAEGVIAALDGSGRIR